MQRFEFQESYILHHRPFQETSLILDVFSKDHGRFSTVAKGARRPKAKSRGLLQPFVPLLVSCVGRGELLTLKDFDLGGPIHFLQGRSLISALYMNELLVRLMHRFDPHPELFQIYREALQGLEHCKAEPLEYKTEKSEIYVISEKFEKAENTDQITLRLFEKSLLKAIGYELQLTVEVESHDPVQPEETYLFDPERGPHLSKSRSIHAYNNNSKSLNLILKGKSLLALAAGVFPDKTSLLDAKRLMRRALECHFGNRPLESRRLL